MPFTFLAHQAPVAPLKLLRPTWFSGTALAVGPMSPDFTFFLQGDITSAFGHTPMGLVAFCLPLSIAVTWLVQRILAAPLMQHLPDCGPFHLRDLALIGDRRVSVARWWLLVSTSAFLGAITHVAWDGFTHGHGWAVKRLPALNTVIDIGPWHEPVWHLLQHSGTVVGAAITTSVLWIIGSRRLLRTWTASQPAPLPAATFESHRRLWLSCAVGVLAGLAWAAVAPPYGEHNVLRTGTAVFLRTTCLGFAGLVVGAVLVRASTSWREDTSTPPAHVGS